MALRERTVIACLIGVVVLFPACLLVPDRWYRATWWALVVCCWAPTLIIRFWRTRDVAATRDP